MKTKKLIVLFMACSLLLAGCVSAKADTNVALVDTVAPDADASELAEPALILAPLPDTTMENLTDAILAVSLEEDGAYVDDTGKMQMDLKIYSYDKYDMVDVASLKAGDVIFGHSGAVTVTSIEQSGTTIAINGGLNGDGFDLVTDETKVNTAHELPATMSQLLL